METKKISMLLPKNAAELISSSALQGTQQRSLSTIDERQCSLTKDEQLELFKMFPTGNALTDYYGPKNLMEFTQPEMIDSCYTDKIPTLVDVMNLYGKNVAVKFLMMHLIRIVERIGGNDKMSPEDIDELAHQLYDKCTYLKLSEMMLYFRGLLDGDYGQPYGAPRVMFFMSSLRKFLDQRNYALTKIESKERERERDEAAHKYCTFEEYKVMKAKGLI